MIYVENVKSYHGEGVYIGRRMKDRAGSVLGNPYRIVDDREEVIKKYRAWLRQMWVKDQVIREELMRLARIAKGGDLVLMCWCSPEPCHGDEVKRAIEGIISKGLV